MGAQCSVRVLCAHALCTVRVTVHGMCQNHNYCVCLCVCVCVCVRVCVCVCVWAQAGLLNGCKYRASRGGRSWMQNQFLWCCELCMHFQPLTWTSAKCLQWGWCGVLAATYATFNLVVTWEGACAVCCWLDVANRWSVSKQQWMHI